MIVVLDDLLCTAHPIVQCYGGTAHKLLGHSTLFTSPENRTKLIACAGDEASQSVTQKLQNQTAKHANKTKMILIFLIVLEEMGFSIVPTIL